LCQTLGTGTVDSHVCKWKSMSVRPSGASSCALQGRVNFAHVIQSCMISHSWNMLLKLLKLLLSLAISWNALEMCCYLLKLLKLLTLLKRLKRNALSSESAPAGISKSIWILNSTLLKRALETLETLAISCYLLTHSWNVLLSLETLETLDALEMLETHDSKTGLENTTEGGSPQHTNWKINNNKRKWSLFVFFRREEAKGRSKF